MALVLPRRLAPVLPTTYSLSYLHLTKAYPKGKHLGFPYHTCVHCKVFLAAAPLRARALISVPFSGLGLSSPLLISGLVSLYLTNNLIRRRLILWRYLSKITHSSIDFLSGFIHSFPVVIPNHKADYRRVTEPFAMTPKDHRLACLNGIPIAATSRRINGNYYYDRVIYFYKELLNNFTTAILFCPYSYSTVRKYSYPNTLITNQSMFSYL